MRRKLPFPEKDRECARANGKHSLETRLKVNEASLVAFGTFMYPHWRNSYHRALEKVDKQQLNRKWFEIYQTISCFGALLLTLPLNKILKLASKSVKLGTLIQIFIESIYVKLLPTLLEQD